VTGVLGQMFMPSDDAARRARIVEQMTSTPQHVLASAWDAIWKSDFAGDAALCRVPALYVGSHAPVADMARLREAMPAAVLAQTAGAGHFHQLEVPDQVNAMIERFLAINALA
jgi:pimeloyl-ACP methyl ester carboxylesterase